MVVAKNDRAHAALAAQFADHGRTGAPFERGYLGFVWGAPDRPHGRIDRPIDRDPRARDRMAVREGGRAAVTLWRVLKRYPAAKPERSTANQKRAIGPQTAASLLACRGSKPAGPTRIRVHLASIGHSLLGDPVYGARFSHQSGAFAAAGTSSARRPWQAGTACPHLAYQASANQRNPSSGRNCHRCARLHDALVGSRAGTGGE